MNVILFDDSSWKDLLPLTFTRPIADLRIGILTIREKWERWLEADCSWLTQPYLSEKFPIREEASNLLINGSLLPNSELVRFIRDLKDGEGLYDGEVLLAARARRGDFQMEEELVGPPLAPRQFGQGYRRIHFPYHIFQFNGEALEADFHLITRGRKSADLPSTVQAIHPERIFVEEGARMDFVSLNAREGVIYIGKDTELMEHSAIRGPFSLGEHSAVKLGSKIYGPTTIGPHSRVGGELNNVVIQGYSNKGHDGFLGNAVLGEWVNIGADSNNSNLKNNYAEVRLWNYRTGSFLRTGLQFCGLIMGDHSKCAINTMFNTGTVVGVFANIFGSGFPRNFIPSFSWGGPHGLTEYKLSQAFEVARLVMERRGMALDQTEEAILTEVFNRTAAYRKF